MEKELLTKKELLHLAKLCSINIPENNIDRYLNQLESILEFVSQLKEVNVDWIEPMSCPLEDKYLELRSWIKDFENKQDLFKNVKHPIKNNWIVIKSAIKW
jgi:aspartyl/glutamyl-tRNA(Asn/Gln) amidotransferase C subunit